MFCTVYFGDKEENAVTLRHTSQRKHAFWGEIKQMSKSKKIAPRNKLSLELLYHRLGHRYNRSFMAVDTANDWQGIELSIYPDPFCTSCQISSMKKSLDTKIHLN